MSLIGFVGLQNARGVLCTSLNTVTLIKSHVTMVSSIRVAWIRVTGNS